MCKGEKVWYNHGTLFLEEGFLWNSRWRTVFVRKH